MITIETWWEDIFSGPLAVGINEQKTYQLEDESFLYFNDHSLLTSTEEQHTYLNAPTL